MHQRRAGRHPRRRAHAAPASSSAMCSSTSSMATSVPSEIGASGSTSAASPKRAHERVTQHVRRSPRTSTSAQGGWSASQSPSRPAPAPRSRMRARLGARRLAPDQLEADAVPVGRLRPTQALQLLALERRHGRGDHRGGSLLAVVSSAPGSSSADAGAMNTDIGWPSSIRRARSAWSAALRRVSTEMPNRLTSTSGHELVEALGGEPVDERLAHGGELLLLGCGARVVRCHLDGARDQPPSIDVRPRRQMDLRIGLFGSAGPVLGDLDAEVLVGGDVEPAPLELVEQAVAGAADVGGVAPPHAGSDRPAPSPPPLRRRRRHRSDRRARRRRH